MTKYKTLLSILFLLCACSDQTKGFDNTDYDLYIESQFAYEFSIIKDQYGRNWRSYYDGNNYTSGFMNASIMFGEIDLLKIKKQVIAEMYNHSINNVDNHGINIKEGYWKPLYDELQKFQMHEYNLIDAWVYWFIFNPQVVIGEPKDSLMELAIATAMSRANVAYWHKKTIACLKKKMTPEEMQTLQGTWPNKTKECMKEYATIINNMGDKIYTGFFNTLRQHQPNK